MSEYISSCPKCHQPILCNTMFTGQRVSCPVCMQEITMPDAPSNPAPAASTASPSATSKGTPATTKAAAGGKGKLPIWAIAGGASVLILAAVIGAFVLGKKEATPAPAPVVIPASTPVAVPVAAVPAATPASVPPLAPGHYKIINRQTGLCLDFITNTSPGSTNLAFRAVLNKYNGTQIWDVRICATNQYELLSIHGPCLELAAYKQNGAQLELAKWVHVPREVWVLTPIKDGYFDINCLASGGKSMEASTNSSGAQLAVQDTFKQDAPSQQWTFQAP